MESDWFEKIAEDDYWTQDTSQGPSLFDDLDESTITTATSGSVPSAIAVPPRHEPNAVAPSKSNVPTAVSSTNSRPIASNSVVRIPLASEEIKKYTSSLKASNQKKNDHHSRPGGLSSSEIIKKVLQGEYEYTHHLKSKEDKLLLLDKSIASCDGNAITSAVLFLEQTMSRKLFNYEVGKRSQAVDHYACYLQSMGAAKQNDLVDFLTMLGKPEEAAMVKLKLSLATTSPQTKIKSLRSCNQNHFAGFVGSGFEIFDFWSSQIQEYVSLLERQLPIEEDDKRKEQLSPSETNTLFVEIPRTSLLDESVISTLSYCCIYHFDIPENLLASPVAIKNAHKLSEKQFIWTALVALSMRKSWDRVDGLFEGKSWLGGKRIKTAVKFTDVARILKKFDAPHEILVKYVKLIEEDEAKLGFAKEHNLQQLFVELCISTRNRLELQNYLPRLSGSSVLQKTARDALLSGKWKN